MNGELETVFPAKPDGGVNELVVRHLETVLVFGAQIGFVHPGGAAGDAPVADEL